MKYRSEIDGLRALAVLPVILFHAGFGLFRGGFVGVDVFFVISGYLITGLLLNDLVQGEFSLGRFYARRARRILPALFCVILLTIPLALLWMLPSQYEAYSRSTLAVISFVSNIFFWRESGYFAAVAGEKPLLHTWSLAVEEQFYLLFPLALWLLWRLGKKPALYGLALATLISLGLCEYASRYATSANFFLLPMRAWELLIGALCAFHHLNSEAKKHDFLSVVGIALIAISVFTFSDAMRLPSVYSLAPALGTALILLYATAESLGGRLLSARPMVGIGLISYSAYLWHHPLFAFAHIRLFNTPSSALMLGLSLLALLLGALTWRLVERPFRDRRQPFYVSNRPALIMAISAAVLLATIAAYGHFSQGRLASWKARAPENSRQAFALIDAERTRLFDFDNGDCIFNANMLTDKVGARIAACQKRYGPGIAIIGDSHAMNIFFVLKERAGNRPFIVGLGQGMCRAYAPLATCNYEPFRALLKKRPKLFHSVIYEQAGWHLFTDARGKEIDQDQLSGLPLDARVPDFAPNIAHIDGVAEYLKTLGPYARIVWLGPRVEPEIAENVVVNLGCDYPFALRPNQAEIFAKLDEAIAQQLKNTGVLFRSQRALAQLSLPKEFLSCKQTYWKDRNHYSAFGERYFGKRITLDAVLGRRP